VGTDDSDDAGFARKRKPAPKKRRAPARAQPPKKRAKKGGGGGGDKPRYVQLEVDEDEEDDAEYGEAAGCSEREGGRRGSVRRAG
jgi:hypothetical protein